MVWGRGLVAKRDPVVETVVIDCLHEEPLSSSSTPINTRNAYTKRLEPSEGLCQTISTRDIGTLLLSDRFIRDLYEAGQGLPIAATAIPRPQPTTQRFDCPFTACGCQRVESAFVVVME